MTYSVMLTEFYQNRNLLFLLFIILVHVTRSQRPCKVKDESYLGRVFDGYYLNVSTGMKTFTSRNMVGCTEICANQPSCVAIVFDRNTPRDNCHSHTHYHVVDYMRMRRNSSVVLMLERNCTENSTVDGQFSNWMDFTPCPPPCTNLNHKQYRECITEPRCNGKPCSGTEERLPQCLLNECVDFSSLDAPITDVVTYISLNLDGRKVPLKIEEDGWIKIMQRSDGSTDFYRNWQSYKSGFGDIDGEFWLGNDIIHAITKLNDYKLKIILIDQNGQYQISYEKFMISNESDKYRLSVGAFVESETSSGFSDSMRDHNNAYFTTYDRDNDSSPSENCAEDLKGAWWFTTCHFVHLNAPYGPSVSIWNGISWYHRNNNNNQITYATMMIKKVA